jgi:hypothetical protein
VSPPCVEILKIRAEELSKVRLVFGDGVVHEVPFAGVKEYADAAGNPEVARHLGMLARALAFFSTKGRAVRRIRDPGEALSRAAVRMTA